MVCWLSTQRWLGGLIASLISFVMALTGCQPMGTASCPTSLASTGVLDQKAGVASRFGLLDSVAGGWIELQMLSAINGNDTHPVFCSALVTFPADSDETLQVWTAQHCYRLAYLAKATLFLQASSGYLRIPLELPDVITTETVRRGASLSEPNLLRNVTELLNGGDDFSLRAPTESLKRCLESTRQVTTACFTVYDLITFDAKALIATNAERETLRLIAQRSRQFHARQGDQAVMETYRNSLLALVKTRNLGGINSFMVELEKCVTNHKHKAAYCSEDYIREGTTFADEFLRVESFVAGGSHIGPRLPSAAMLDLGAERLAWTRTYAAAMKAHKEAMDKAWITLGAADFRKEHPLLFATNIFQEGKARFQWLPVTAKEVPKETTTFTQDSWLEMGTISGSSRTFLFKNMKGSNEIVFNFGDSGSMLLLGAIPVAAMSHKDGMPTSEGASMLPLPQPRGGQTAGSGNAQPGGQGNYDVTVSDASQKKPASLSDQRKKQACR